MCASASWPFGWAVWHSCRIGDRSMPHLRTKGPPTSAGPHSGGKAAFFFTPMHPLYSTRPHVLVQAIFWRTCLDLDLGPWYCSTHETHIALSGSMISRFRVSARSRHFLPIYPHFYWPSGFWPWVKFCLVGGSAKYRLLGLSRSDISSWWDTFWPPVMRWAVQVGCILSLASRDSPPWALTFFGGVGFIARHLRRPF